MVYEELDPPARHRERVVCYWRFVVEETDPPEFEHAIVPDGTVSLLLAWIAPARRPMALFAGPRRTALRVPVHRGSRFRGVRFKPGSAPLQDISALVDRHGLLDAVLPGVWARTCAKLQSPRDDGEAFARLEAEVDRLLEEANAPDEAVLRAVEAFIDSNGFARVGEVADAAGLSARHLLRRFRRAVGLAPKEFAMLRRARWACVQAVLGQADWVEVAGESGFADQAHLNREFRRIFGWTPAMIEDYLRRIEHRRFAG